jgi:hypothetical protein
MTHCSMTNFATVEFYLQYMNLKARKLCKIMVCTLLEFNFPHFLAFICVMTVMCFAVGVHFPSSDVASKGSRYPIPLDRLGV